MELLKLFFGCILFVLVHYCGCLNLGSFIIDRKENENDVFLIPNETCKSDIPTSKCSYFGASNNSENRCQCSCPYYNATFTFHNGFFRCIDDKIIRKSQGCDVHFVPKSERLKTIKKGSASALTLPMKASNRCIVDANASRYLGCDGSWYPIHRNLTLFNIRNIGHFYLYVKRDVKSTQVDGRLFRLSFTDACEVDNRPATCLLFKLNGRHICPVETLQKPTILPTFTHNLTTVVNLPTKIVRTTENKFTVSVASMTVYPSASDYYPSISTSPIPTAPGKAASSKNEGNRTQIIVIAVSANAVLIAVIAILVLAMCRMRRRHSSMSTTSDEGPYEEIPFGDDSILVGDHAYARLYSTKKKKNARQRGELGDLKNFPNPAFEEVPYEIPMPPLPNEQKDESRSYARLYDTVRRKNKVKRKDVSVDSGVDSACTSSEDLTLVSPVTPSSQKQQQGLVYSYTIPLPEGSALPPLPRPRGNTSPETRQSAASYDYATPDSPQEMKEVKNQQPDKSQICSKPDKEQIQSKATIASGDSIRSAKSEQGPYYHVLDSTENASAQNVKEKKSNVNETKPYDVPEAVINAAFEGLEDETTDGTTKKSNERTKAEQHLPSVNRQSSHKLAELPFRHSTTSQISGYTLPIDSEERSASIEDDEEEENSGGSSSAPEVPERTMERLLEPIDSLSECSSDVKPPSDTSSLNSATGEQNKPKEEDYVINCLNAKMDLSNGDNVNQTSLDHEKDNNSQNEKNKKKPGGIKIANTDLTNIDYRHRHLLKTEG